MKLIIVIVTRFITVIMYVRRGCTKIGLCLRAVWQRARVWLQWLSTPFTATPQSSQTFATPVHHYHYDHYYHDYHYYHYHYYFCCCCCCYDYYSTTTATTTTTTTTITTTTTTTAFTPTRIFLVLSAVNSALDVTQTIRNNQATWHVCRSVIQATTPCPLISTYVLRLFLGGADDQSKQT
jgi:hypothetical protein